MTLQLSEREVTTLAVALRAWQNELSYYTLSELQGYYPQLEAHQPLSIGEVDQLLARVGAGDLEGGEATVRSVRTVSTEGAGGAS